MQPSGGYPRFIGHQSIGPNPIRGTSDAITNTVVHQPALFTACAVVLVLKFLLRVTGDCNVGSLCDGRVSHLRL